MTDELTIEQLRKGIEPKSDQLNYEDVATAPLVAKVTGAKPAKDEKGKPTFWLTVEGYDRPYKPCLNMRRVILGVWGYTPREWLGRHIELYGDATVAFGGQQVGGIRIRAMSGIDAPVTVKIPITRGKRIDYVVQPLKVDSEKSQVQNFRDYLAAHKLRESDACDHIGKSLDDADANDWAALRKWAKGA